MIGLTASGASLAALSGIGSAASTQTGRNHVGGLEELNQDFEQAIQTKGKPEFVDAWSVIDDEVHREPSNEDLKEGTKLQENGYKYGSVEQVRFEDGSEKTIEVVKKEREDNQQRAKKIIRTKERGTQRSFTTTMQNT